MALACLGRPAPSCILLLDAKRAHVLLFGLLLLYAGGYAVEHLASPLGQAPQLDGKENAAIAVQIAGGDLPREPFYRAMLYPALLALPVAAGLPHSAIPFWAALLGVAAHLIAAWLVFRIALHLWKERRPALVAGALYGMYPVAVYFAAQPLDVTVGIALFLAGIERLLACAPQGANRRAGRALAAGLFLGLAVLTRPHFLAAAPFAVVLCGLLWGGVRNGIAAAGGIAVLLIGQTVANGYWSGTWQVLPWQGAYNLYAANRVDGDGRYFQQQMFFHEIPDGANPARIESEALYGEATGEEPPYSINAMNAFWRAKTAAEIRSAPLEWVVHKFRMLYYLGHNWEAYNNQTYAFHKARSRWLRLNPLGWGLLLAAAIGAGILCSRRADGGRLAFLAVCAAAYAGGVLLFFVSARFRLPLAPLLCVFAAGLTAVPWRAPHALRGWAAGGAVLALAWSFSPFWGAYDRRTFLQDKLLLANAAAETGFDGEAYRWARAASTIAPGRPDARRIALISYFNLRMQGAAPPEIGDWAAQQDLLESLGDPGPALLLAAGTVEWNLGDPDAAAARWRDAWRRYGPGAADALGALLWTGLADLSEAAAAPDALHASNSAILGAAIEYRSASPGTSPAGSAMRARMQRVFPPAPD